MFDHIESQVFSAGQQFRIQCSSFPQVCVLQEDDRIAPCAVIHGFLSSAPWVLSWLLTCLVLSPLLRSYPSGPGSDDGNKCATEFVLGHLQSCQKCHWAKCTWEYRSYTLNGLSLKACVQQEIPHDHPCILSNVGWVQHSSHSQFLSGTILCLLTSYKNWFCFVYVIIINRMGYPISNITGLGLQKSKTKAETKHKC